MLLFKTIYNVDGERRVLEKSLKISNKGYTHKILLILTLTYFKSRNMNTWKIANLRNVRNQDGDDQRV